MRSALIPALLASTTLFAQGPTATPPTRTKAQQREIDRLSGEIVAPYKKWLNEEVVWIIRPEERSAFVRLETDDERQQFIEQFWLRRDPTPDTSPNEYKEEHYRRIAGANDQFLFNGPGWKTDRGAIYIRFGAPDEREEHPSTANTSAYERWRYKLLEGIGNDVIIEFVDLGEGDFRLIDPKATFAVVGKPGPPRTLIEQLPVLIPGPRPTQ